MKIVIDARLYGLENAGLGRYVINLTNELKKLAPKQKFYVLLRNKYYKKLKFPSNWKKILIDVGHYGLYEQVKLPSVLKRINPDLVHFPHFNIPLGYRGKFVVTIHDLIMHKSKGFEATTLPFYKYAFKRVGYWIVFASAVSRSAKVIVPSKTVRKELIDYYNIDPRKVKVTYEGMDFKFKKRGYRKVLAKYGLNNKYFIYVGNAYPHKNLERAVEAVEIINQVNSEKVVMVFAGSRSVFTKRLKSIIEKHNAEDFVKIVGYVKDEELAILLSRSEGFVYPSLDEGFGLQGLESLASGTILLASDIEIFREIYAGTALYFDPLDVNSIANTMQVVLDMKRAIRKRLVAKGKKLVKKYSWTKMAKKTLKVYQELV